MDVWQENIYISIADTHDLAGMQLLLETVPRDRLVFGENYPLDRKGKRDLLLELSKKGLIDDEELERIAWKNAAYLFGIGRLM